METKTTQIDGYADYPLRASVGQIRFQKPRHSGVSGVPKTKSLLLLLLRCML